MRPGPQLDELIEKKIFDWKDPASDLQIPGMRVVPSKGNTTWRPYSTDIAAAWRVVEELDLLSGFSFERSDNKFQFAKYAGGYENDRDVFVEADTAPLAICLAALKAKGISF